MVGGQVGEDPVNIKEKKHIVGCPSQRQGKRAEESVNQDAHVPVDDLERL